MSSILFSFILLFTLAAYSGTPMLPAKKLIFLLIHGEGGKGSSEGSEIFNNLKKTLESTYDIEGRVFAYNIANPAGALDSWVDAISDATDNNSIMMRARRECSQRIAIEQGATDSNEIDQMTPKEFVIFAHSFAGLAVREYICSNKYRGDVRMLITLNTPNEGTEYPHILEVLETRTALKRLQSIGTAALKEVDAKNDLLKNIETIYELKKTYNSAIEVVDEAKRIMKNFRETKERLLAAKKAIEESANALNPKEIVSTINSSIENIKAVVNKPPEINKGALKALQVAVTQNLTEQFSGSIASLYKLLKELDSASNGNLQTVISDPSSNRAVLKELFAPDKFIELFSPEKLASFGVSNEFQRRYRAAACIINKPEILLTHSTNLTELYQKIALLLSYRDSLQFDPNNLVAIDFNPNPAEYIQRLKELKSVKLIPKVETIYDDIMAISKIQVEWSNLIQALMLGKKIVTNTNNAIKDIKAISFFSEVDSVEAIARSLANFRATPNISRLKEQFSILRRAANALSAIRSFDPAFSFAININTDDFECALPDAIEAFDEIEKAIRNGYYPPCDAAYLNRLKSFFAILKKPEITLPRLSFSSLPSTIESPESFEMVMKIFGITEYVTNIISAFSGLKDAYDDVTRMASQIEEIFGQFSGETTEAKDEALVGLEDLISLGMMAFSVAKMLPKKIEGDASQSASLNTIGKKVAKALMKELWKEIEDGGLLEVGFAETMRNKSGPSAADPVMASMAVEAEEIKRLMAAMPISYADSALNQTKYRIVATSGVLTPTKSGAKAFDFACGSGGTEAALRGRIQAELDRMVKRAIDSIKTKITKEVLQESEIFTERMCKEIERGMEPGGKLKERLNRIPGGEEAYRLLVDKLEEVIGGVVETLANELASTLANMGAKAVLAVVDKLKDLEPVQKAWEKLAVLDAINPATIISIYSAVEKVIDDDKGLPLLIASAYFSPLLKLGLYENGDFISTSKSQKGESVALFKAAKDVKRTVIKVDHPLKPFVGIALLGMGLDAAALIVPDPASKETIRITKIITVNLLSAGVAFAKKEKMQHYFIESHNEPIRYFENSINLDKELFDTPSVTIKLP